MFGIKRGTFRDLVGHVFYEFACRKFLPHLDLCIDLKRTVHWTYFSVSASKWASFWRDIKSSLIISICAQRVFTSTLFVYVWIWTFPKASSEGLRSDPWMFARLSSRGCLLDNWFSTRIARLTKCRYCQLIETIGYLIGNVTRSVKCRNVPEQSQHCRLRR